MEIDQNQDGRTVGRRQGVDRRMAASGSLPPASADWPLAWPGICKPRSMSQDGQPPVLLAAHLGDFGQGVVVLVGFDPQAGKTGGNEFRQSARKVMVGDSVIEGWKGGAQALRTLIERRSGWRRRAHPSGQSVCRGSLDKAAKTPQLPLLSLLDLFGRLLVEFGGKLLADPLAQGRLHEPAGLLARPAGEALGRDRGLALGTDEDFNGLQAAPPWTWMTSLIAPSASFSSRTQWPLRRASLVALATA